jgi:hypothetical protein
MIPGMRKSLGPALVVVATLAAPSAGCRRLEERMQEKAIEKGTGGQVQVDDQKGTITVVTDAGAMTLGASATLPADFPASVAIYPHATPSFATRSLDAKGKQAWSVLLETSDSKDKVAAYYKANMTGFTQASTMDMGQSTMSVYQSPKYEVSMMIAAEPSAKTAITLSVASK